MYLYKKKKSYIYSKRKKYIHEYIHIYTRYNRMRGHRPRWIKIKIKINNHTDRKKYKSKYSQKVTNQCSSFEEYWQFCLNDKQADFLCTSCTCSSNLLDPNFLREIDKTMYSSQKFLREIFSDKTSKICITVLQW